MNKKNQPILQDYGIRLRPVKLDDADFIINLRNMPHVKGKMGDFNVTLNNEKKWIENNYTNPFDYFFIIESLSLVRLGTIGVYDIDFNKLKAQTGRIVVIPGSLSALPASILLNDFCFNDLSLERLYGCVVSTNKEVIAFNQQLGYTVTHISLGDLLINSLYVDMAHVELLKDTWHKKREKLIAIAKNGYFLQNP